MAGFGYDFNLNSGQILTEIRTGYSLMNMMNTLDGYIPEYDVPQNPRARNLSLTLIVGYRFTKLFNKNK